MGIEDNFTGARAGFMFYNALLKTVSDEIGMDRAVSLHTKACETMGATQGKMLKEQAGTEEIDAKAAWSLAKRVPESIGVSMEVVEESPQEVVVKLGKCPVYSAAKMLGMDHESIESMCRSGAVRIMDTMTKQLNPNLSHQLRKFRSSEDDFCEEAIVQG